MEIIGKDFETRDAAYTALGVCLSVRPLKRGYTLCVIQNAEGKYDLWEKEYDPIGF